MITALVTGGTGFVGSHIARALVERGYQVRILRRTTSRLDAVNDIACEHYIGDVMDLDSLRGANDLRGDRIRVGQKLRVRPR